MLGPGGVHQSHPNHKKNTVRHKKTQLDCLGLPSGPPRAPVRIQAKCWKFLILDLLTDIPSSLGPLGAAARTRRPFETRQGVVGHRRRRFRTRTHPRSGPEQSGNRLGKFHFSVQNHHFPRIPLGTGPAPWEGLWAVSGSPNCVFLCLTVFFHG